MENTNSSEESPETRSIGQLATSLASTIQGLDSYHQNLNSTNQPNVVVVAPTSKQKFPGYWQSCVVAIDERVWNQAQGFLDDSNLVLVRR